jgi:hypothetical protein
VFAIVVSIWTIGVSLISAKPSFVQSISAQSSPEIVSWRAEIIGTGNQRLLNVTVEIANRGYVTENFTITLLWEALTPVATQNVTNFASGAIRWFTLTALVSFDPTTGHNVGLSAGTAWVASPIYRPPGYGSVSRPWWDDYLSLFVGLGIAMGFVTTLLVARRLVTKRSHMIKPAATIRTFHNTNNRSLRRRVE